MSDVLEQISKALPPSQLLTSPPDMEPYCMDWRGRVSGRALCVALPASTQEAAAVVRACADADVPVFPQGGNTGLCYGAVPKADRAGVVIALGRMNKIRRIDRNNNSLICDAGLVLTKAHEAAAEIGRHFPLHLGSEGTAQIGGLISTNAGGTGVLRYGPMRDLVLGLEVVLPDGRIWSGLSTLRKDNTAYDLKHLFIGAEGTLGVVTGAALKLFPAMQTRADAWVAVKSPHEAVELLSFCQDIFDTRIQAFEMMSKSEVEIALANIEGNRIPFGEAPAWSVLIELGDTDAQSPLTSRLEQTLADAMEKGLIDDAVVAQSQAQAASFWRVRHTLSEAHKKHGVLHAHDISVPVAAVPEFIAVADGIMKEKFPKALSVTTCHLGDGNIHYMAMYTREDWAAEPDTAATISAMQEVFHDLGARFGGSFSAEHGVGRKLVGELQRLTDPVEMDLLRTVKQSIDPGCRMNPGAIF